MPTSPNLPIASLCLYGGALDPVSVSGELKCEPNCAQTKGQSFVSASGKQRTAETGLWMLHSDRFCTSSIVREHMECILEALKMNSDMRTIRGVELAVLHLALVSGDQPELLTLPPELLKRLAELGLTLKIDAY
jgi:hypothetical protein